MFFKYRAIRKKSENLVLTIRKFNKYSHSSIRLDIKKKKRNTKYGF